MIATIGVMKYRPNSEANMMKRQSDSPANAVSGWYPRNRGRQFGSCETGRGVVARGDGCSGAAATRNTRLQYVLYEDGGVHCGVAEEEEHRDQRGDGVDVGLPIW